jgi:hypothetical protein
MRERSTQDTSLNGFSTIERESEYKRQDVVEKGSIKSSYKKHTKKRN